MTTRYDLSARNVLGGELEPCSLDPVTGFFRISSQPASSPG